MIYVANVIECLIDLGDVEFQRRVWVNGKGPEVSSLDDLLCQLFDDTGLGDSIENQTVEDELGEDVPLLLDQLENAVNSLDRSLPPNRLVESQAMQHVREKASELLMRLQSLPTERRSS